MPTASKTAGTRTNVASGGEPLRLFLKRLMLRSVLTEAEQRAILDLPRTVVEVRANQDFVRPGDHVDNACLVGEGLIARFEETAAGRRQITAFHLPGDMADLHSVVAPHSVWGMQALTRTTVLLAPHEALRRVAKAYPALAHTFWRDGVIDSAMVAQALLNLGRRDAASRLAHLFCELALRYRQIGREEGGVYVFPATQTHIADAMGLTPIHVNRTLAVLRTQGLVSVAGRTVTIHDWDGLADIAEFDPQYLQHEQVDFH